MGQQWKCCQRIQQQPFLSGQMRGTESPDEKGYFRYGKLEQQTYNAGRCHQRIIPWPHGKYGFLYIPHAHSVIQLAHSQYRKGVGLGSGQ